MTANMTMIAMITIAQQPKPPLSPL